MFPLLWLGLSALGALSACGTGEPAVCSTQSAWTDGDDGSPLMHPGGDCIGCHTQGEGEGPRLQIAGTVMNDFKDDTDCNGVEGVTVEISDANGKITTMQTNAAGNFFTKPSADFVMPFTAKLTFKGKERAMKASQTTGACAACHTASGANGAPGRIVVPK